MYRSKANVIVWQEWLADRLIHLGLLIFPQYNSASVTFGLSYLKPENRTDLPHISTANVIKWTHSSITCCGQYVHCLKVPLHKCQTSIYKDNLQTSRNTYNIIVLTQVNNIKQKLGKELKQLLWCSRHQLKCHIQ